MEKDLEKIREALRGVNLKLVSNVSGIHYNTVRKVYNGKTNVSANTIKKLKEYLEIND